MGAVGAELGGKRGGRGESALAHETDTHNGCFGASIRLCGYDPVAIDSDNNNAYAMPDRMAAEFAVKNTSPGKIIIVNDAGIYHDGVPGYVKGLLMLPDKTNPRFTCVTPLAKP